ncbi:MAG: CoA-acylating methylmalonate-semialdehyde dehydrogenase [Acidobacteriales bacterium]|nr:CoA-acylating methylmalonate-semialdehyde dehydrogenase [Candidatus Koribacter versatilis]MBI3646890.1 CoA-acylating methylmalonate-semialdehyde dehydrogenase [Terriglobales bacterium]
MTAETNTLTSEERAAAAETKPAARILQNYIGGSWVSAKAAGLVDVTNPANGEVLARAPLSGRAEVEAAVAAASAAWPEWRARSVGERTEFIYAMREGFRQRVDELAASITRESGKVLSDARAEVTRAIEVLEVACASPMTMQGRILEGVARGINTETIRQSVGVCAAITPFNFPAMVPMWFLPFAIVCGNTFVLKPSEQVPLTSEIICHILEDIGLPRGVVNLVHGAHDAVNAILDSPEIRAVSFVGSVTTAKYIYRRAAENGKRVQALGGAKNYMIVMPDAVLDKTVSNILGSAFGNAGQRCMAGSVLVTVGSAQSKIMGRLKEEAEKLIAGDGTDPKVSLGPVISSAACDRIHEAIETGVREGAELLVDGRRPARVPAGGYFVGPTILNNVKPEMRAAREEIFGPVLSVMHVDTLDEAIDLVNRDPRGNGTSIFTENGAAVREYSRRVEVGMVGVNIGVAASPAYFPFSGWKDSFFGDLHVHGWDAVEFFTRKKTVTSRYFSAGETGKYFVEQGDKK